MTKEKRPVQTAKAAAANQRRFKVRYVFYFALALLFVLSLASYSPNDINTLGGGCDSPPENWIGNIGAWISYAVFLCCGFSSYVFLGLILFAAIRLFLPGPGNQLRFLTGAAMIMLGAMLLFAISPEPFAQIADKLGLGRAGTPRQGIPGGVIGQFLAAPQVEQLNIPDGLIRRLIGPIGTMIVGWAFLTAGLVMIYLADFHQFIRARFAFGGTAGDTSGDAPMRRIDQLAAAIPEVGRRPEEPAKPVVSGGMLNNARAALAALKSRPENPPEEPAAPNSGAIQPEIGSPAMTEPAIPRPAVKPPVANVPAAAAHAPDPDTRIAEHGQAAKRSLFGGYTLPPPTMLAKGTEASGENTESIIRCREKLQETLDSFGVAGQVCSHISGPRVTRYEIQLAPGVKVDKVVSLENNIAMNLEAKSIRILAPIPGRNVVGVEAPNSRAEAVFMRSIMESPAWLESSAEIPIILGRDVAGKPVLLDLAKAPHLLIAGTTGSGKSVCMNTLIMSLLFRFRPDELKLILVDPKVVEHEAYQPLPHLITPVVNDSQKVPIVLRWAVAEMEKRYRILARVGVKNLHAYNRRTLPSAPVLDNDGLPIPEKLPLLVVILDELADLMMTDARKDVETSIARIAQKGRAAGIHIVIATQRPSRDIITGVIRANLPSKIAFMVGKRVDSQVILDQNGAESLLGKGDMLYLAPGSAGVERVQGAMVDDRDIAEVVKFVSAQAPQEFNTSVTVEAGGDDDGDDADDGEFDDDDVADIAPVIQKYLRPGDNELLKKALEIVLIERKASTSYLQRRLGIGYNRAAELIDVLEERGIVGPPSAGGSKRDILVFDEIEG
jgi:S-DNA-T family DNA segregation ATPase FtsK/SpoIIIE